MSTAIFIRASALVIGEPELFTSLAGEVESFKRSVFAGIYIVETVVIVGCGRVVRKTVQWVLHELMG